MNIHVPCEIVCRYELSIEVAPLAFSIYFRRGCRLLLLCELAKGYSLPSLSLFGQPLIPLQRLTSDESAHLWRKLYLAASITLTAPEVVDSTGLPALSTLSTREAILLAPNDYSVDGPQRLAISLPLNTPEHCP